MSVCCCVPLLAKFPLAPSSGGPIDHPVKEKRTTGWLGACLFRTDQRFNVAGRGRFAGNCLGWHCLCQCWPTQIISGVRNLSNRSIPCILLRDKPAWNHQLKEKGNNTRTTRLWSSLFFSPKQINTKSFYNFQQRMSGFPQRWRTQRNAIRNANCKTSWIIKILNAHCTCGIFPEVYLAECLRAQLGVERGIIFNYYFLRRWPE